MDRSTEKREKDLDDSYQTLKANLAKEKQEFRQIAEDLEGRSQGLRKHVLDDPNAEKIPTTLNDIASLSLNTWALAQVNRLAARMTQELEHLYASNYAALKGQFRIEKELPTMTKLSLDDAIAKYEDRLDGRLMSKEDKAMLAFFYDYFMGDQK
jgi:hypothetical protein